MTAAWRERAFAAHANHDTPTALAALEEGGEALLEDSPAMQLKAILSTDHADELALLEYAALEIAPFDAGAFFNLAVVLQERGENARAVQYYEQALRIAPDHLGALNNLSDLLRRQNRPFEAHQLISRYLTLGGSEQGLEVRLAKIADDCGFSEEASKWFGVALKTQPDVPQILWEGAMQQLRDEDFAAGWQGFEARRKIFSHDALAIVSYSMPEWQGEGLEGRSLLVHREQGLGDSMMFASCLTALPKICDRLHIAVQPSLVRLFRNSFPKATIWPSVSTNETSDEAHQKWLQLAGTIDYHIPMGSLPLHTRSDGFPLAEPYLNVPDEDRNMWRQRLLQLAPNSAAKLRAGLVISARRDGIVGAGVAEGAPKCVPPIYARKLETSGVCWFGLHDRSTATELAEIALLNVVDTSDWLHDFADTAALIEQLDIIVAVDTAVAHLAGALGKKVLLMLRNQSDWRWGRTRKDSYWYPDVEVFRQEVDGDWEAVLQAVSLRLSKLVDEAAK